MLADISPRLLPDLGIAARRADVPVGAKLISDMLYRSLRAANMRELRRQQHHRERLSEALREEIETILEGELGDPRIGLVNVTEVQLAPDGKSAHVFVTVQGEEAEADQTLKGLMAARGFIRHAVGENLNLRHAPELFFALDKSQQDRARIDQLLQRIKNKKK